MDFVRKELCDGVEIKQKHDFFGYVSKSNKKRDNQTIDLYTDAVLHDKQIKLWSKGKFDETVEGSSGREIAKLYREQIRGSDGIIRKDLKDSDAPLDPEKLICQVKSIVKSINFNEPSNDNTSMFLTWLKSLKWLESKADIKKFLDRSQSQFLYQFAPYTAYVYTMRTLFDYVLLNEKTKIHEKKYTKNNEEDSDWMDLIYTFYFPFIDCFESYNEKFINIIKKYFPCFVEKIEITQKRFT
jgi:hypothetical protein